ncbi:MAG: glycosyl transferase [Deltaproteobacteria bacterium HGW-Deltaproteobacteria-20]|nr:MAG: glycosyl transferase [Deltaproteobacteria bacterium HGW-Deltaproteobacteria-20]
MPPLVSVLLPYRNVAATIEQALDSILAQSYPHLEVCAVDDGSSDDGPSRVAQRARRDPRVHCLATGGLGLVPALQHALAASHGTLVARMDGDDVSLPTRIERQVALLRDDPTLGVVGVRVEGFPEEALGEGMRQYIAWQNGLITTQQHTREMFVEAPLCHPTALLRRDVLEAVGGWQDVRGPEDYDLWLRLDAAGWKIAKVPEVLFRWRHRPGRATFADGRYALERFRETKAGYLARRVRALGSPMIVWGAGPTGKRLARELESHALRPSFFVDIDPRKIGRTARGVPIRSADMLRVGEGTVVVAVGARGARDLIRSALAPRGFLEGEHYLFVA